MEVSIFAFSSPDISTNWIQTPLTIQPHCGSRMSRLWTTWPMTVTTLRRVRVDEIHRQETHDLDLPVHADEQTPLAVPHHFAQHGDLLGAIGKAQDDLHPFADRRRPVGLLN